MAFFRTFYRCACWATSGRTNGLPPAMTISRTAARVTYRLTRTRDDGWVAELSEDVLTQVLERAGQ
jgi:hypothetical protein